MFWSIFHAVTMIALFAYMMRKAQFAETKKVALVPLATGMVDILAAGLLNPGRHLMLTVLLLAMRLVIFGCCVLALRRDAAMAKQKARRRAQRRRLLIAEVPAVPSTDEKVVPFRCA